MTPDLPPSIGKPEREPSAYDPAEAPDEPVSRLPGWSATAHIRNPSPRMIHTMTGAVPMVIGLGGLKGSGKDTVADILTEEHPREFVKIGMSDPLHEAMLALDPIVYTGTTVSTGARTLTYSEAVAAHGYVKTKETFPEARRLLQRLGTEVVRDIIDPDAWVKLMRRRAGERLDHGYSVLVTAVRFRNELDAIHELNGLTVWVERPGLEVQDHASENTLTEEDFDLVLSNDEDLEALRTAALDMVPVLRAMHRNAYPEIYDLEERAHALPVELPKDDERPKANRPADILPLEPPADDLEVMAATHPAERARRRPASPTEADFYTGPIGTRIGIATTSTTGNDAVRVELDPLALDPRKDRGRITDAPNGAPVENVTSFPDPADKGPACPVCDAVKGWTLPTGIRQCALCGAVFVVAQDSVPEAASAEAAESVPSEHGPRAAGDPAAGADPGDRVDVPPEPLSETTEPDGSRPGRRPRRIRRGNL